MSPKLVTKSIEILGWLELRWAIHPRLHEVRFLTPQTYPAQTVNEKPQDSNSN
jgi:hypothetical protein